MYVLSLAFSLKSVAELVELLLQRGICRYNCTYRFSQDHLELLFSCIRQRGGSNNNPSAALFPHAYRAIQVHADVAASKSAIVLSDLDGVKFLRHQDNITSHNEVDATNDVEQ